MIIGIIGSLGKGKTLSMTYLSALFKSRSDARLLSNYHTQFTDIYVETPKQLDEHSKKGFNIEALDELWAWMDSRESNKNDTMNNIVLNSRKRGDIIIYTTQRLHMVDRRLRGNTDYVILPQMQEKPFRDICTMNVYSILNGTKNRKSFVANPIYGMYDTTEEVSTESDKKIYKELIEDAKQKFIEGRFETKKDAKGHLYMHNEGLSKQDAEMVANEAHRIVKVES